MLHDTSWISIGDQVKNIEFNVQLTEHCADKKRESFSWWTIFFNGKISCNNNWLKILHKPVP
jgi:hypothetical protein